mgnify:FL=1
MRRKRRPGPTRAELVQQKYLLEGQINVVAAELKRLSRRGESTQSVEARLERLRSRHYQTRLEIDRTDPG